MDELYQKDLASFLEFYEKNHICPYYFCSKAEIDEYIKDYLARNEIECDNDFVYFFRSMLKKLVGNLDSHTIIRTRDEYDRWPLKLEVSVNAEKVRVTATSGERQEFLGREVVKINGIEMEKLIEESKQAISYSTEGWRKAETGRFLSSKPALRSLPSIESNAETIVYTFADGEELKIDSSEEYQETKTDNYSFDIRGDLLMFHYTACREDYVGQMQDMVQKLQNLVLENKIKRFMLDLSGNIGGNDLIIQPLIDWLRTTDLVNQVRVNRYTQSAGLFALNDMHNLGAKVVGEEIGSSMNHVGNNLRHELPSGKFLTIIATRYFYLDKDNNYQVVRTRDDFHKLSESQIQPKYIELS